MPDLTRRRWLILAGIGLVVLLLLAVLITRPTPEASFAPPVGTLWGEHAGDVLYGTTLSGTIPADVTTTTMRPLPDGAPIPRIQQPDLARDGSRLAFVGFVDNVGRIYVAQPDGSDVRPVSSGPRDSAPAIAPDGSQVVFVHSESPRSALFITDAETGAERQLTDYTNDLHPAWSPDGSRILFTTSRDGFQELYSMAPVGTDLQRLTATEGFNDLLGTSPRDGTQIAYTTNTGTNNGSSEIWVMDADGQHPRQLTHNDLDEGPPVWSPDGRFLAFSAGTLPPELYRALYVYDLTTDALVRLTPAEGRAYHPIWSPGSTWIAFLNHHADDTRTLDLVDRAGRNAQTLLAEGNEYFAWVPE